jgi:hypothetical protein
LEAERIREKEGGKIRIVTIYWSHDIRRSLIAWWRSSVEKDG